MDFPAVEDVEGVDDMWTLTNKPIYYLVFYELANCRNERKRDMMLNPLCKGIVAGFLSLQ